MKLLAELTQRYRDYIWNQYRNIRMENILVELGINQILSPQEIEMYIEE